MMLSFSERHIKFTRACVLGCQILSFAGIAALLCGCTTLGSESIVTARTPVNEAVADTARQQTLMNIVRVYNNESPLILDVVEADEAVNVGATPSGGMTNIGAIAGAMGGTLAGRTGSAMAGLSAGDNVTNRYVPLQGQALINQLSSQITVETLNALYDSDWPIHSILELAADRLTPAASDMRYAEDLITLLDSESAIALATAKSGFSKATNPKPFSGRFGTGEITIQTQPQPSNGGDSLNIYRQPSSSNDKNSHLEIVDYAWRKLYEIYKKSQPNQKGHFTSYFGKIPNLIELRNSPVTNLDALDRVAFIKAHLGPVMRTRTAIGILKYLTTHPSISFISLADYSIIKGLKWNTPTYFQNCPESDSYVLDPSILTGLQKDDHHLYYDVYYNISSENKKYLHTYITKIGNDNINVLTGENKNHNCIFSYAGDSKSILSENRDLVTDLSQLKRLILVVKSNDYQPGSFAHWSENGVYYSVMSDDYISQRNLMLVSQFLTIQATSTPTPSVTTISPTGR